MNARVAVLVSALFLSLALGHSQNAGASELFLNYQGVTAASSTLGGNSITAGTSFDLQIGFNTTSADSITTGVTFYSPNSIEVELGGDPIVVNPSIFSTGIVGLLDTTNPYQSGDFIPAFSNDGGSNAFSPFYAGTTTPGWTGASPTATVFTGYGSYNQNEIVLTTNAGELDLAFDDSVHPLETSITSTPEGSSFTFMLLGLGAMGLGLTLNGSKLATIRSY